MSVCPSLPIPATQPYRRRLGAPHRLDEGKFVRGLTVETEIGVNADEYGRRQPLVIDVELELAPPDRCEHIAETVNYETVLNAARELGQRRPCQADRNLRPAAGRGDDGPDLQVMRARVRIESPQALAQPTYQAAGVEITLARLRIVTRLLARLLSEYRLLSEPGLNDISRASRPAPRSIVGA